MNKPLDELYLNWLYEHIADASIANPRRTYWTLATVLYTKEFIWYVPNDDNRCADGRDLRVEFAEDLGLSIDDESWMGLGCSVLELMIGLSRRLSFLDEGEPREWFWELVDNLGLRFSDRDHFPSQHVEEVLNRVIWRTYRTNGRGGFFPLRRPDRDQRDVELWVQLNNYLLERS